MKNIKNIETEDVTLTLLKKEEWDPRQMSNFLIEMNWAFVYTWKTLKWAENKFEKLVEKYNLV